MDYESTLKPVRILQAVDLIGVRSGSISLFFNHSSPIHYFVFLEGLKVRGLIKIWCHYASPVEHFTVQTESEEVYFAPPGYAFLDLLDKYSIKDVNIKAITVHGIHSGVPHDFTLGKGLKGTLVFQSCEVTEARSVQTLKRYNIGVVKATLLVKKS